MTIYCKLLHKDAKLPVRANPLDAGLDLFSIESAVLHPHSRAVIGTGIAIEIPPTEVGLVWPRSGLAVQKGIDTMAGVIDSCYRGEVRVVLYNTSSFPIEVEKGDKIAQLLIQPVVLCECVEVSDLEDTSRGSNGFGSSGR
jgi:dUTP pyrophosphatase